MIIRTATGFKESKKKKDLSQVVEAMKVVDLAMVTSTRLERLD